MKNLAIEVAKVIAQEFPGFKSMHNSKGDILEVTDVRYKTHRSGLMVTVDAQATVGKCKVMATITVVE